jgi:hypothetical protein
VTSDPRHSDSMVARFDALLRDLITFGLAEPTYDPDRPWQLTPAAQRRLEALASPTPPADKLIYFGHRCAGCGEHRATKFRGGTFVCQPCLDRGRHLPDADGGQLALG